eukprot:Selendium_serpulae@DN10295_c0_g1_i1.p1
MCNHLEYLVNKYYHRIDCELPLSVPADICAIYTEAVGDPLHEAPCMNILETDDSKELQKDKPSNYSTNNVTLALTPAGALMVAANLGGFQYLDALPGLDILDNLRGDDDEEEVENANDDPASYQVGGETKPIHDRGVEHAAALDKTTFEEIPLEIPVEIPAASQSLEVPDFVADRGVVINLMEDAGADGVDKKEEKNKIQEAVSDRENAVVIGDTAYMIASPEDDKAEIEDEGRLDHRDDNRDAVVGGDDKPDIGQRAVDIEERSTGFLQPANMTMFGLGAQAAIGTHSSNDTSGIIDGTDGNMAGATVEEFYAEYVVEYSSSDFSRYSRIWVLGTLLVFALVSTAKVFVKSVNQKLLLLTSFFESEINYLVDDYY